MELPNAYFSHPSIFAQFSKPASQREAKTFINLTQINFSLIAGAAHETILRLAFFLNSCVLIGVQKSIPWGEYTELAILFFLQWMAMGMWFVPLTGVLDAHGYHSIRPYAFAASAVAAFVSPLLFGAMADRHASPVKVLRWLALASAAAMACSSTSIQLGWPSWAVLLFIQFQTLCTSPVGSISTTIVFSRLRNPKREFGPIRAVATFGWMCGCWLISAIGADTATLSGYGGAIVWVILSGFTFLLPSVPPPPTSGHISLSERMGWDALSLLKNKDHRVVFITAALFSIPMAAFYPWTPPHLQQLGLTHFSAWMSLGQVSEIVAMMCLAKLLTHWRLKWIFVIGLSFGVIRYAFCAFNTKAWLLAGISLHGITYTLYFITAQIYLEERIDTAWRARAQALMALMIGGFGNLSGYLSTGWWYNACASSTGMQWTLFWTGISVSAALVLFYFGFFYQGQGTGLTRSKPQET